jgi:hypothetical protein
MFLWRIRQIGREKRVIREFRLSPPGTGRGLSCDANGAFVAGIPLLKRLRGEDRDQWAPRDCNELSKQIGANFGLPIDMSSKIGGLKAICSALNEDDIARAQIAAVLLAIPDPPSLKKSERSRSQMIKFILDLDWSGLLRWDERRAENEMTKAGYDPAEPRGDHGRWTDDGECNRTVTARRRWTRWYNRNWPIDEETGRYQDVAHIRARADGGGDEPENIRPLPHSEHVREHMERGDFSRWAQRRGKVSSPEARQAPETTPKTSGSRPTSTPKATPKSAGAARPAPEPMDGPIATPEEPVVPDEVLIEEIPFIMPE